MTLELLELCLGDVEEGVEELLPGRAALLAEVVAQGCAQVLEDHLDDQLELLPEDAPRVVVPGYLNNSEGNILIKGTRECRGLRGNPTTFRPSLRYPNYKSCQTCEAPCSPYFFPRGSEHKESLPSLMFRASNAYHGIETGR